MKCVQPTQQRGNVSSFGITGAKDAQRKSANNGQLKENVVASLLAQLKEVVGKKPCDLIAQHGGNCEQEIWNQRVEGSRLEIVHCRKLTHHWAHLFRKENLQFCKHVFASRPHLLVTCFDVLMKWDNNWSLKDEKVSSICIYKDESHP
ncbi:unnamed protein product [Orchesella dallaii]|uniref:Uncharacterized protein n=1 Tax=Orchesella dallaii TaxID=48710 RepID=A0ABP1PUT6_9HEXA